VIRLTLDLRQQTTARGRTLQAADAARIGGVVSYASACRRRSMAARQLHRAHQRLREATEGYAAAGLPMEWYRTARWEYQAAVAASGILTGAYPAGCDW
jgi:hypothetical protein